MVAEDTEASLMEENIIEISDMLANNGAPYEVAETELLEELTDSDTNAQTGHLHLNIITGGTQTILPRSRRMGAPVTKYFWCSGKDAKELWNTKYKYEGYKVRAPVKTRTGGLYAITFCHMWLEFPKGFDFGDHYLTLYPDFSKVGQRHVRVYATQARDDDPASRLALRVMGKRANGKSFDLYLSLSTESAVERANAFTDRILEGIDEYKLRNRPRRWVPPKQNETSEQQ